LDSSAESHYVRVYVLTRSVAALYISLLSHL